MVSLSKVVSAVLNPVFMGKALAAGTQIIVVLFSARVLAPDEANLLFSLLALSAILTAVASFGANGALVPFLFRRPDRAFAIIGLLLGGKMLVSFLGAMMIGWLGYAQDLPPLLIAWTAFSGSLLFLDFIAESRGSADVDRLSRIKFMIFGAGILLKIVFFYFSFTGLLLTLYAEWIVIWLFYFLPVLRKTPGQRIPELGDIVLVGSFLASSSWVWLSTVVSFGWTRVYFVLLTAGIGAGPANAYFVVVRLVEGFTLVPNTLAMRFFPDMVALGNAGDEAGLMALRFQFLRLVMQAALAAALAVPLIYVLVYGWSGENPDHPVLSAVQSLLVAVAAFLLILRVALSREIILTGFLPLSIISYLAGAITSFSVYHMFGADSYDDALLGYAAFAIASFGSPFLAAPERLRSFRHALSTILWRGPSAHRKKGPSE
ncbi:hypothetical protein [Pelagovum sp. HNIBRBA483]|uniref:hypothetical protein n=1 Tax=Pelagovum sp. HNIBRBA483 TaxID=3233341 RepID=UPI0034A3CC0A